MQGFRKKTRMAVIAAAFAMVGLGAGSAQAYPMYDDAFTNNDCHSCHPDFSSVGSLHNQHVINFGIQAGGPITNRCNVCHTNGGGTTPVYTFGSNGGSGGGGFGCAGCHGQDYGETASTAPYAGEPKASGWGLRRVHQAAGVTVCQGCHGTGPVTVLDETSKPPYYPMHVSSVLRDPCSAAQEDLSYVGPPTNVPNTTGLDNDGNGFADYVSDPNCLLPSTTTTSTTTTTTTTLPVNCGASPVVGCTAGAKTKLLISEKAAGKEKVKFLVSKLLPAVVKADFGAPVTSDTSYALCIYNASNVLVGSYEVARGSENCGTEPCWSDFKDTGYAYADKDLLTADGVSKIQLAGGDAGKGKVMLQASNKASTMPTGVAAMLSGATSATAQLVTSDGDCFGMALPTVKKADGVLFSASAP